MVKINIEKNVHVRHMCFSFGYICTLVNIMQYLHHMFINLIVLMFYGERNYIPDC